MKPTKEMLKEYAAIAKASKRNMKGYLNQQTVDGIRSLFDACGLGFHG